MGFYDLYRARMSEDSTDSEIKQCSMKQKIIDDFEQQPNYHLVYLNTDTTTQYKTLISEGKTKDDPVGHKILTSYPYDTYVFDSGDYVKFTYGGEDSTWLITSIDKMYLYNVKGRIVRCNNDLKWIDDDGNTQSYKCVIDDLIREDQTKTHKQLLLADGYIYVTVQNNSTTSTITQNKRFIFNTKAYKVRSIMNFADTNTITFAMSLDLPNVASDDLTNNIANDDIYDYQIAVDQSNFEQIATYTDTLTYTLTLDGNEVVKDVEWVSSTPSVATINSSTGAIELLTVGNTTFTARMTDNTSISDSITVTVVASPSATEENRIDPNITNVLQGDTQAYTVYKYIDNVANSDTFTITVSGASTDYYTITTSNNGFSVTSLGYTSTPLTVLCTNNTDASTVSIIINLKGLW